MKLTDELKTLFVQTAEKLKGIDRRLFMAQVVSALGKGGQRCAQNELGWCRDTIRKGTHELESGIGCVDNFSARGRKPIEAHLPNLLSDIKAIVDCQSQTDPTFATHRLYTRLSAREVRQQLIKQKGYTQDQLPSEETIRKKLNQLGYHPRRVLKSRPEKKVPQTDAIFEQLESVNRQADEAPTVLRLSIDAKAPIPIGPFSRGGKSRVEVKTLDHDFDPEQKVTSFGIFLPEGDQLYLYLTASKVTADLIVDCITDFWETNQDQFPDVKTMVINSDNGPENNSRRTQFIKRLVDFADEFQLTVQLAHYPPYHSKYNPIERTFGVFERHINGSVIDCVKTLKNFAQSMTYNQHHPVVKMVEKVYQTGVRLTQKAMKAVESRLQRLSGLENWFVHIRPLPP